MANLIHDAVIHQLYTCVEYLDSTVKHQDIRVDKLEQLCRDLWECSMGPREFECVRPDYVEDCPATLCDLCVYGTYPLVDCMKELGLLEGVNNGEESENSEKDL